eukprot:TRINITY_DN15507_c0_g1_i1.p1 TRINITY_DN15507_c0_g1~~TRINITY_DN15507_c0_g1_i1.p1  ORF type:complete len:881 (+),score=160.89 TRINITY_DN15507_c0_g1_i1:32-2674(+)
MMRSKIWAIAALVCFFCVVNVFHPVPEESRVEASEFAERGQQKLVASDTERSVTKANVTTYANGSVAINGVLYNPGGHLHDDWDELAKPGTFDFYLYVSLVLTCVIGAALAAGLTMGLVSVDIMKLHVTLEADLSDDDEAEERFERDAKKEENLLQRKQEILQGGISSHGELADIDAELQRVTHESRLRDREEHNVMKAEKLNANRILPVVAQRHLLLVTLLLTNAVAAECMPIFLDRIVPSWIAIVLSVSFVLIFGEIVPSAIFTGKHHLRIAAFFTPLVRTLMFITGPISYPISKILDYTFGEEEHDAYNKDELKAFIRMHGHREQHQAVVVLRPHPQDDLQPPQPPSKDELEEAYKDAKILNIADQDNLPDPHDARFCGTDEREFRDWLEKLLQPTSFYPAHEWGVLMHPMSSERRDMNKARAHFGFASSEDANQVCDIINRSIVAEGGGAWLHGWVRVEAEVAESSHAVRMQKLADDECAMLCGVIGIGETPVGEAAHLIDDKYDDKSWKIFMLSQNTILDRGVLAEVMRRGHSRVPIYQVNEFIVTIKRSSDESYGIHLSHPGPTPADPEPTWGYWNRIGHVTPDSPAARVNLDHTYYICAVNGVRLKKLEDFMREMKKTDKEVKLTLYRDDANERKRICGMLLAKKLLVISPEDFRMVGDVTERFPLAVAPDETLLEALSKFRQGGSHMAIVTNNPEMLQECWNNYRKARLPDPGQIGKKKGKLPKQNPVDCLAWAAPLTSGQVEVLGILTLEDVLEEFMGDIIDETDMKHESEAGLSHSKKQRIKKITAMSNLILRHDESRRRPVSPGVRSPAPHYASGVIPHLRQLGSTSSSLTSRLARVKSSSTHVAAESGRSIASLGSALPTETTPLIKR